MTNQAEIGHSRSDHHYTLINFLEPKSTYNHEKHLFEEIENNQGVDDDEDNAQVIHLDTSYPLSIQTDLSQYPLTTNVYNTEEDANAMNKPNDYVTSLFNIEHNVSDDGKVQDGEDGEEEAGEEALNYFNPFLVNLIYYQNPLKKRNSDTNNRLNYDNSMIVKKMPENERWSTPIQPGNSKDLRKIRNLSNQYSSSEHNSLSKKSQQLEDDEGDEVGEEELGVGYLPIHSKTIINIISQAVFQSKINTQIYKCTCLPTSKQPITINDS
ncbi:unnamed protein product [Trichobilharzia szidati]|nr:unnamed protein product [Trichobilharzia szidati]